MNHKLASSRGSRMRCTYCLCGNVMGPDGPVANMPVQFMTDCVNGAVCTDENGNYCIAATMGANVAISIDTGLGVTLTPPCYQICSVRSDFCDLDFIISPLVPETFTVSGTVSGLADNANIPISYEINGQIFTVTTQALGDYSFSAPAGATIVITPPALTGYTATPANYTISNIAQDTPNQNFVYTPA